MLSRWGLAGVQARDQERESGTPPADAVGSLCALRLAEKRLDVDYKCNYLHA